MAQQMKTNEKMILLHQKFADSEELLTKLAGLAKDQGLVDDTYLPALVAREKDFPTGLEFPINISISHIETGVKRSFVCITTLDEPVMFKSMDLSGDELQVQVAFVFGIVDPKSQVEVLSAFARAFANEGAIRSLLEAETEKELLDKLNAMLDGMLAVED